MRKIYFMARPSLKDVIDSINPENVDKSFICVAKRCFSDEERDKIIPISKNENDDRVLSLAMGRNVENASNKTPKLNEGDTLYIALVKKNSLIDAQTIRESIWKIDFLC